MFYHFPSSLDSTVTMSYTVPLLTNDIRRTAAPLNRSVSGYGGKIPTDYQIRYGNRWCRVYGMVYGNGATLYIRRLGNDLILDQFTESML